METFCSDKTLDFLQELLKFILRMKWQAFPLLVSICSGLQRSGRKISDVSDLTERGEDIEMLERERERELSNVDL